MAFLKSPIKDCTFSLDLEVASCAKAGKTDLLRQSRQHLIDVCRVSERFVNSGSKLIESLMGR